MEKWKTPTERNEVYGPGKGRKINDSEQVAAYLHEMVHKSKDFQIELRKAECRIQES